MPEQQFQSLKSQPDADTKASLGRSIEHLGCKFIMYTPCIEYQQGSHEYQGLLERNAKKSL